MIYCTKMKAQPKDDALYATAQSQITILDDTWYRVLQDVSIDFSVERQKEEKKRIQSA